MKDMKDGPRQISDRILDVDLTGYLIPGTGDGPVVLGMPGTTAQYLPIFSTLEKLQALLSEYAIDYVDVKTIDDTQEFLRTLPPTADVMINGKLVETVELRLIVDPHKHENGLLRFTEVLRDN